MASSRPQTDPAPTVSPTVAGDPPKPDTPPLTAPEKDDLFRRFDSYVTNPGRVP